MEPPSTYEKVWSIFVSNLTVNRGGTLNMYPEDAYDRAAQFLRAQTDPKYVVEPPFEPAELNPELPRPSTGPKRQLHPTIRVATRDFAVALAHAQLAALAGVDAAVCHEALTGGSSAMEAVWSIFVNVLDIDDAGAAVSPTRAMDRAAQYLRSYCGGPREDPPYAAWEIELPCW